MAERMGTIETIQTLIGLLKSSGLYIDARITETVPQPFGTPTSSPRIRVDISGPDAEVFLRKDGELLQAVHHLAVTALDLKPEEEDRLWFDVSNEMTDRLAQMRPLAEAALAHVRSTSTPYTFTPMTSGERRLLSLALAYSGLASATIGDGFKRCLVLYPEGHVPPVRPGSPQQRSDQAGKNHPKAL